MSPMHRKSDKLQYPSLFCLPFDYNLYVLQHTRILKIKFLVVRNSCCHFVFSLIAYSSWAMFPLFSADRRMPPCSYMLIYGFV